jgi:hypothetical protein
MNKMFHFACVFFMCFTTAQAASKNTTNGHTPEQKTHYLVSNEDNEFIRGYYSDLRYGLTEEALFKYWAKDKISEFNWVAKRISKQTGKSVEREKQNMLGVINAQAVCENNALIKQKRTSILKSVRAKYRVANICSKSELEFTRNIEVRYSASKRNWEIISIQDVK